MMPKTTAHALLLSLMLLSTLSPAEDATDSLNGKPNPDALEIDYLLEQVKQSNCIFIRNGKKRNAEKATSHLRRKYDYALKKHGQITAEQFIQHIATKSSWSGKRYSVECPGENPEASADWLTKRLDGHRANTDQ